TWRWGRRCSRRCWSPWWAGWGCSPRSCGARSEPRPVTAPAPQDRFPGFAVMRQAPRWDEVTALAIRSRVAPPTGPRFFTAAEQATARALVGQLLDQPHDDLGVPVMEMIDARLADGQTDGWRYED